MKSPTKLLAVSWPTLIADEVIIPVAFPVKSTAKLLALKAPKYKLVPCTPRGCLELLDYYEIDVKSMNIVIIGCSNLVGLPLSIILLQRGATVIICHKETKNTKELVQQADMIVTCCGVPYLVKEDWVKKDTIIIDIGINTIEDKSKKKGYRVVGDMVNSNEILKN